jgi:hypothetical protein
MEMLLFSTDYLDIDSIVNEESLYEKYLFEESTGHASIELFEIDSFENANLLIQFLFNNKNYDELFSDSKTIIYDLTKIKGDLITFEDLEIKYQIWLNRSKRNNTMDEYGALIGFIGYINRHPRENYLLIRLDLTK